MPNTAQPPAEIAATIRLVRGQRVLLDVDLAQVYGVTTKRLNEQVRRNSDRFPPDFLIQLTNQDLAALRSQLATLNTGRGAHRKYPPVAFTEHGALMAATVLNSPRAVQMSVYIVRAFARLRQAVAAHSKLAQELEALKQSVVGDRVANPTPRVGDVAGIARNHVEVQVEDGLARSRADVQADVVAVGAVGFFDFFLCDLDGAGEGGLQFSVGAEPVGDVAAGD